MGCMTSGIFLNSPKGSTLIQSGSGILIAAMTLFGVLAGLQSWEQAKQQAREVEARRVYAALTKQLMSRFVEKYDAKQDAELRAEVSTWASAKVVQALGEWNLTFTQLEKTPLGENHFRLSTESSRRIREATAGVVTAIRDDLGADSTPSKAVEQALFNES